MTQIINIAAYKFVGLADLEQRKTEMMAQAQALALKGTILLTPEGINLFLAGPPQAVHDFVRWLHLDPRLTAIAPKESWSASQPFRKLLVKVKNEIIRMNHPAIQPQTGRAPAVAAATLKRWLDDGHDDQGRPVVTLDTRNASRWTKAVLWVQWTGASTSSASFPPLPTSTWTTCRAKPW